MYWVFLISVSLTVVSVHTGRYALAAGLYVLTGICWLANSRRRPSMDRPPAVSTAWIPVLFVAVWPVAAAVAIYWFWERHHREHRYLVHYPPAGRSTSLSYDHPEWLRSADPGAARTSSVPSASHWTRSLNGSGSGGMPWHLLGRSRLPFGMTRSVSIMDTARFGRPLYRFDDWAYAMFWVNRQGEVRRFR